LPDEERVRCEGCKTPHHQECFQENEGCASYGCRVRLSVPSGQSIYLRPNIKIEGIPGIEQHDIGPFLLNLRPKVHQPERRRRMRCPVAYTRLGFEDNELRAGDVLKGRAVLYLPEPTKFKRLELVLTQGISNPKPVQRLELPVVEEASAGKHPPGSYPYELELVAPDYAPPSDPYQFTLVLRTGLLSMEQLRSDPRTVFLLKRKLNLPSHVAGLEGAADGNALVLPPPGRRAPRGPRVVVRPTDRLARRGVANLSESSEEAPGFAVSVEPEPFRASGEGGLSDPFASSSPQVAPPLAEDPFAQDPFGGAEWSAVPCRTPDGPRALQARLFAQANPPRDRLEIGAPRHPYTPEFTLQVSGGQRVSYLTLAVQAELVRPGGQPVDVPELPYTEEVVLVGEGAFSHAGYATQAGVDLIYSVRPELLALFAQIRRDGAHNAALRLHLGAEALTEDGSSLTARGRSVTLTGVF